MWSTPIPNGSAKVNLKKGTASLSVKDALVFDAFTVPNSLDTAHPLGKVNAIIDSLRMEWTTAFTKSWTDCADGFQGDFFEGKATIEVTATTPTVPATTCPPNPGRNGFRFVSNPATTSISHFAQIGSERNGVFFSA
ncbi:MAG: hypothetical protein DMF57_10215 [Acidobacteria bacterium]|nr:MAG: hypothetical protein DMF57_10215 [Acidobacteriota bacterium]